MRWWPGRELIRTQPTFSILRGEFLGPAEYGLSLWMECALGYIPITINSCAVLNHERQRNIQGYSINDMGLLRTS